MFHGIAGRYDLLNHLLSGNLDRGWRRAAARELGAGPRDLVLDLCGGTGDLSLAVAGETAPDLVVCCDFAHGMLTRARAKFAGRRKDRSCVVLEADGLRLPLPDATFDGVLIGFGVRNFASLEAGLVEIRRVLKPGGKLVVLEFSEPTQPTLARLYRFYLRRILPRIGDGVSGRTGPYRYLASTIASFPNQPQLAGRIREAGFGACGWRNLSGGIVALHTAYRGTEG
jgi:demethylmenaquinone methyltransferase/2-methoxy-6-polyprenyl-1,4-benzoquinol methylase